MAAFGKPFQAFVALVEVPIDDDDVFVESRPRSGQIPAHEVVVFVRVVARIEHVAPHIDAPAGIDLSQNLDAGLHVVGKERARIELAGVDKRRTSSERQTVTHAPAALR